MRQDIPALTGLRGIAALWVVIYHLHEFDNISAPAGTLIRHGYLAVDVFFVLSGFLMALSYRDLFGPKTTFRNFGVFLMRRLARVYPLYAVLTLVAAAMYINSSYPNFSKSAFGINLVQNLAMVEAWGAGSAINGPGWSISTEAMAYVLFPLLAAMTVYARPTGAAAVGIIAFVVLVLITGIEAPTSYRFPRQGPLDISWEHTAWPLVRCLAGFVIGLVAYRMLQTSAVRRWCSSGAVEVGLVAAITLVLLTPGSDLIFVALVAPAILVLAVRHGPSTRILASRPAMILGELSYAIYLLHGLLIWMRPTGQAYLGRSLSSPIADVAALVVFYVTLLACAWVCYTWIERPSRRAIRSLERRMFRDEDDVLAASEARAVWKATLAPTTNP